MTNNNSPYKGDAHLETVLKREGIDKTADEIRDIIDGVLTAPAAKDKFAWLALVGSPTDAELRVQLTALKDELAAGRKGIDRDMDTIRKRVAALRAEMKKEGIDGFAISSKDEYAGEYVPVNAHRLPFATGFTGSFGESFILDDAAAVFTDGRYEEQIKMQVPDDIFDQQIIPGDKIRDWLRDHAASKTIGYDPMLVNDRDLENYRKAVEEGGGKLKAVPNLVDRIWKDRPAAPLSPVVPHEMKYAGEDSHSKRNRVADELSKRKLKAAVITTPDSIAWLLNIRGNDVPNNPLPLSFAVAHDNGKVDLFIDPRKVTDDVRTHLGPDVTIHDQQDFLPALEKLAADISPDAKNPGKVLADPNSAPVAVGQALKKGGARVIKDMDPVIPMKAIKNATEVTGMIESHKRDGAALTEFLHMVAEDRFVQNGTLTELDLVNRLEEFRAKQDDHMGPSFDTISSTGEHGAVIHYKVEEDTDRPVELNTLYLVDSGGQYKDGTTDVTRTVAIGTPTQGMKDDFTRVLKGHIQLAMTEFPEGTSGKQLDAFARMALWKAGKDYNHGTGHGVGSFLNVHEGPASISKGHADVPLKAGMVLSNEPGFYKSGEYGIRIENLVVVEEAGTDLDTGSDKPSGKKMLRFKTITQAPIDRNLIEPGLMNDEELDWLNNYHKQVRETLTPRVDAKTAKWLAKVTAPIQKPGKPANDLSNKRAARKPPSRRI